MALTGRILPYRPGYDIGIGVIATTGMRANKCIAGEVSGVEGAGGGAETLTLSRITTTEDLESALNISAEASGGVGLFEANARFDFANKCRLHSQSLTLLVTHTVEFGFNQIDMPALTADGANLAGRRDVFSARYGDLFISGLGSGGMFVGTMVIEYSSQEDRKAIEASISGSYGLAFSADASTKLQDALTKTRSSVRAYVYVEGGSLAGQENPQTPEQMLAAHSAWYRSLVGQDGKATGLARPYYVQALPYVVAAGPLPPNEADLQKQLDVLARCASLRSAYLDKLNLVTYMVQKPQIYEYVAGTAEYLQQAMAQLEADLQHIGDTASYAKNHPGEAKWPEVYKNHVFTVLDPERLPRLKAAQSVDMPDLSRCRSEGEVKDILATLGLALQVITDTNQEAGFKVLSQTPGPGTPVPPGAMVTITVPKMPFSRYRAMLTDRAQLVWKSAALNALGAIRGG